MTPEEQALLAAIAAHPDADLPRLVYSDWLHERNDERFEMVRDRELFARMGPNAENPVPKLLDELEAVYADDTDYEEIERLEGLVRRCGAVAVGPLLPRLRSEQYQFQEFALGLASEHPAALAAHRPTLEELLTASPDDGRAAYLQLLVCAGQDDDAAIAAALREADRTDERFSSPALDALRQAKGAAAEAVLNAWLPALERDLEHPHLDDEDRTTRRTECLAGMETDSPRLTDFFRRAAAHPNTRLAVAAAQRFGRSADSAEEAARLALRGCTLDTLWEVVGFVRNVPGWERLLAAAMISADTPHEAKVRLARNLNQFDGDDWPAFARVYAAVLERADVSTRCHALQALQESSGPTEAIHALIRSATEADELEVRRSALQALVQRDDTPKRQRVAILAAALGDRDFGYASHAFELIGLQSLRDAVVERLRGRLESDDEQARARAVAGLGRLGGSDSESIEDVFRGLRDRAPAVRRAAAQALGEVVTDEAKNVFKPLRKALADPDAGVRQWVAVALGKLGEAGLDALPDLLEQTRDEEPRARAGAFQALGSLPNSDPRIGRALLRGLRDDADRVVKATLDGLWERYHPEPALQEAILPHTRHEREDLRLAAFQALGCLDESAVLPEALKAFARGVVDPDDKVAEAARQSLYYVRKAAEPIAERLVALFARTDLPQAESLGYTISNIPTGLLRCVPLLEAPDAAVRSRALFQIQWACKESTAEVPALAAAAVPYLPGVLARERGEPLLTALQLIDAVGAAAADCYPAVLPLLDHSSRPIREKALSTIGRLGRVALPTADRLAAVMLNDPNPTERAAAAAGATSLAEFDPTLAAAVARQLREGQPEVRREIARRCVRHPALAPAVIPALARCLAPDGDDTLLRRLAAEALGRAEEAMRPFVPNFARLLSSEPDDAVRRTIAEALGQLGAVAADVVSDLMTYFRREDAAPVREALIKAFAKIPAPNRGAAVALGLTDPHGDVREQVGMVLAGLGREAVAILPAVCRAMEDPEWDRAEFENSGYLRSLGIDRREMLLEALHALGPIAEPALPALVRLLDDAHSNVRHRAAMALARVGPAAIPALKKAARHRDTAVRDVAVAGLEELQGGK